MKKLFAFLISISVIATLAYAIDREINAPSGNLKLTANDQVYTDKRFGVGIIPPAGRSSTFKGSTDDNSEYAIFAQDSNDAALFGVRNDGFANFPGAGVTFNETGISTFLGGNTGFGVTPGTPRVEIRGPGTGSSDVALRTQNSSGQTIADFRGDGSTYFAGAIGVATAPTSVAMTVGGDTTINSGDLTISTAAKGVVFTNGGGSTLAYYQYDNPLCTYTGVGSGETTHRIRVLRIGSTVTISMDQQAGSSTANATSVKLNACIPTWARNTTHALSHTFSLHAGSYRNSVLLTNASGDIELFKDETRPAWSAETFQFHNAVSFSYNIY